MADHRAEQIMDKVTALVTGLGTTGTNVMRDRVYDVAEKINAALSIYIGDDDPIDDSPWPYIDSLLTVYIDIHARNDSSIPVSKTLNRVRKELVLAIMVDVTLGLPLFVQEIEESIASAPIMNYGDQPISLQRTEWTVKYRRSLTDPSE